MPLTLPIQNPPFKERRKRRSNVLPWANFLEFASKIKPAMYISLDKSCEKKERKKKSYYVHDRNQKALKSKPNNGKVFVMCIYCKCSALHR